MGLNIVRRGRAGGGPYANTRQRWCTQASAAYDQSGTRSLCLEGGIRAAGRLNHAVLRSVMSRKMRMAPGEEGNP